MSQSFSVAGSVAGAVLTREANAFHQQFFQRAPAPEFIRAYLKAHAELPDLTEACADELRTVQIVVERGLDALGLEPWLRAGARRHLLSRKLLLIAYLAECDGAHPEFRRAVVGRTRAYFALGLGGAKALIGLLRGRCQKARYGLV